MLRELRIRNIAIIDELTLRPSAGLNVLSGETGAGKSIIVDALELALGAPAPATALREGASNALIEAQFELASDATPELFARLEEEGLRDEEAPEFAHACADLAWRPLQRAREWLAGCATVAARDRGGAGRYPWPE